MHEDKKFRKTITENSFPFGETNVETDFRKLPQRFPLPEIVGLLELDWSEKLQEWRQMLGREYWCLRRPVAVFFDDRFIGSDVELIKLVTIGNILMEHIPRKNMSSMMKHFRKDYISYLKKSKRIYCYLDICVDEVYAGTLTFELYSDVLPRTCENFKTLCLGSRGPLLSYRGSRIHRIVKKGWLQGGDIQYKTGGGGFSIFCDPLEDECFGISHDRRGVLSMASGGRHTNASQFFITLQPSQWMDTHFVAFGQLVEGVRVLRLLENLETFYECPLKKVEIKSCGKLDLEDVEDVDVMFKEEPMPAKKRKKIETISEQVVRLILEALTEALARKERTPDILDDGDIPSKMNLQLYFQGFYSLPESALEETAAYLRKLRRQLLRVVKPNATEVVEVIMYDLLMAVLTRMTTLDDVRETIGHDLYRKMISGIDMKLELCQKSYVRRLIDQIISTAENMVNLVSKKIDKMKEKSANRKKFLEQMQDWVNSFVLQETFKGDNYFIAERPLCRDKQDEEKRYPKREGKPCCEEKRKQKEEELKAKLRAKYGPEDLCCLGSKLHLSESEINLYDFFSTCRYDLKKVPKVEEERMPLLDLIEISRFKLRFLRKQENRVKSKERLCLEKKMIRWLSEVAYTPETSWLKESVFPRDCLVYDHVEEIMYGAMTAGLLEMYYFMEQYVKTCGGKKQVLVTRTIYPEDSDVELEVADQPVSEGKQVEKEGMSIMQEEVKMEEETTGEEQVEPVDVPEEPLRPPCQCGHPCCKCAFDPFFQPPPPPPSPVEEEPGEGEGEIGSDRVTDEKEEKEIKVEKDKKEEKPCASDETFVDLKALLAEKASLNEEEIDIKSFKWLRPYILEKGCDLKSEFAAQVHKWMDGERFCHRGFISKHSLASRASLLSLSISLAEMIREENNLKVEVKNFVYDLWDLYFEQIFKEALLEYPPEPTREEGEAEAEGQEGGTAGGGDGGKDEKETEDEDLEGLDDECKRIIAETPNFDFEKYCAKFGFGAAQQPEVPEPPEEVEMEAESKMVVAAPSQIPPKAAPSQMPPKESPRPTSPEEAPQEEAAPEKPQQSPETEAEKGDAGEQKGETPAVETPVKKKKSPIVIEELVDVSSGEEIRQMPPYVPPFWVKFLTELTKQALGAIAKVSRLPRRLYFKSDSEVAFDEKMKGWFEFNAFNPQPTKGREIMDYIALHHTSLTSLEDTARSYLKKKKLSGLVNRCTRFDSADDMAGEIVADVIDTAMDKTEENETLELFVSNLLSTAVTGSPVRSQASVHHEDDEDFNTFETDKESLTKDDDTDDEND